MARVQERTAAKDYPQYGITKGDKYFYVKIKTGPYSSREIRSKTRPKRWELTTSDFYSQLWPIEDEGFDGIEDGGGLRDIAEQLRELGSEQQEKFDNMPDGLQQGDSGQMVEERANACEAWADDIDTAADELDSKLEQFDAAVESGDVENVDELEDVELTDEQAVAQARQNIIDEFVQQAQDANPGIN
jgi:hypothetical protein